MTRICRGLVSTSDQFARGSFQRRAVSFHTTHTSRAREIGGGAGCGNVQDPLLPVSDDLFRHCTIPRTVSVIGAPMTYGQPFVGTDSGPMLLREAGLLSNLSALGWRVEDLADLDFEPSGKNSRKDHLPNAKNCALVGEGTRKLADTVEQTLKNGRFPLILGGDHSIAIGSLAGVLRARPETGIIWVDAHADINTPDITESGNLHGMPIGMFMDGLAPDYSQMPGFEWLSEGPPVRLSPDSIVYVGLRDVDAAERSAIRKLGIKAFTMHDIDHYGIGKVMDLSIGHLLAKDPHRPLHLSYDIDAIDPVHAPATGTAVRGGLTFREAHFVAEAAAASGNLASAEIVELNPTLSDGQGAKETVGIGLHILTSLMGQSIL